LRIGIVSDIHDDVTTLRTALTALRREGVEQVVSLGDAFDSWGLQQNLWVVSGSGS